MKYTFRIPFAQIVFLILVLFLHGCSDATEKTNIEPGSYQLDKYIGLFKGKNIAIVANHTSMVGKVHLIDTLNKLGVRISKIFSPEHGFYGIAEAGVNVNDENYNQSPISVVSLYGSKKKPSNSDMEDIDLVVFDIQDVGVRFYTYLSTLHYVMEACAENNLPLIVLDRPNPNGYYIDGPVLQEEYKSFIGMHPVPLVYGMTIGEYALMINGEGWLKDSVQCELSVIRCNNYKHSSYYTLPENPSPNLRDMKAIYLYPSLALFEGTIVSEGRGTSAPFLIAGHPDYPDKTFTFTPEKKKATDPNPKLNGKKCYGIDLRSISLDSIRNKKELNLTYLMDMYISLQKRKDFFIDYFDLLSGTNKLRDQIIEGESIENIKKSWQAEIEEFKKIRIKYLLYPDFE
jgi:uncharacterized protein YbbC (DUF1343 family)